jgi:hypothetical protein
MNERLSRAATHLFLGGVLLHAGQDAHRPPYKRKEPVVSQ